jgi:dTDP-4-amino-4,6-dideoxygalactose transaminase
MLHHNAIPIFVDVEWETMLLAPSRIEAAVTRKTRAIMPVHYWGVPCDMAAIMKIACKHNLHVIEDCCQAHGATFKDRKVGTMGHCNAFSLNQNKNFCGGEGGLLVTDDEAMYVKARALMSFGEMRAPEASRDFHSYGMGWMYRTNDLSAAFARSQLTGLDRTNALARENFDRVQDGLKGLPDVVLPFDTRTQRSNAYAYVVRVAPKAAERRGCELSLLRDATKEALRAEGVPVASARWMLPAHTVFQAKNGYGHGCPWRCGNARKGISYDLKQYPVTTRVVDSCIQVSINGHRPPNGARQINAIIKGVRKVFENLDQVPLEAARP